MYTVCMCSSIPSHKRKTIDTLSSLEISAPFVRRRLTLVFRYQNFGENRKVLFDFITYFSSYALSTIVITYYIMLKDMLFDIFLDFHSMKRIKNERFSNSNGKRNWLGRRWSRRQNQFNGPDDTLLSLLLLIIIICCRFILLPLNYI